MQHNEAGRGAELSELVLFKNKLYTFDDRTGIMFELQNYHSSNPTSLKGKAPTLVPRGLFMEGDGSTDKGMKVEWATVKDGLMWVGSFGKEYTANDGSVLNINNLWVKVMSERGVIQHVNWEDHYNALRRVLGYDFPAYILHEAITWSPHHKRWFVLPRRVSKDAYDEQVDEKKGSNLIISCSPDFSDIQTTSVGVSMYSTPMLQALLACDCACVHRVSSLPPFSLLRFIFSASPPSAAFPRSSSSRGPRTLSSSPSRAKRTRPSTARRPI